jgi:tight adherence protein B
MTPEILTYVLGALAFLVVGGVGFVFAGGSATSSGKAAKRIKSIGEGVGGRRAVDANATRRKQMDATMKGLRDREEAVRQNRQVGKSIEDRIKQAGFTFPVSTFYIGSAIAAVVAAGVLWFMGFNTGYKILVGVGGVIVAGLGLPRWFLGMAIKTRQKKFIMQFADAIDVIVRGVKSGLPLNECLRIIAKESPQPIQGEFAIVCDALAMGVTVDQALTRMYQRTPIQEVNFFNIVLAIQAKAGGNLSEALGNLSAVLRSRKMLREKIKALSSEAKASAMIIGALPIIVMLLVYLTTPAYIMELFTNPLGHLILLVAAGLMGTGIYIMRQMINFDF